MDKQPERKTKVTKLLSCLEGGYILPYGYQPLNERLYPGFAKNANINPSRSGGRSLTRFGSANKHIPCSCDQTNKGSFCITFIARESTAAGHPLLIHF